LEERSERQSKPISLTPSATALGEGVQEPEQGSVYRNTLSPAGSASPPAQENKFRLSEMNIPLSGRKNENLARSKQESEQGEPSTNRQQQME